MGYWLLVTGYWLLADRSFLPSLLISQHGRHSLIRTDLSIIYKQPSIQITIKGYNSCTVELSKLP